MTATDASIDATMQKLLAKIRRRVDPNYEPLFRCAGNCEDTGWIVVDDGLLDNVRVKAPTVKRCGRCGGNPPRREAEKRGGSFS